MLHRVVVDIIVSSVMALLSQVHINSSQCGTCGEFLTHVLLTDVSPAPLVTCNSMLVFSLSDIFLSLWFLFPLVEIAVAYMSLY